MTQSVTKKGRPTFGKRAMTGAQRQRRRRKLVRHKDKRDWRAVRELHLARALPCLIMQNVR